MEQVGDGRGGGELGGGEDEQRHPRPPPQQQCPRCDSLNTKFCYYNNYSLLQPRYFCKTCKRSWTQGGTMRNIPIGGNRRGKRSISSSSSTMSSFQSQMHPHPQPQTQTSIQEVVQNHPNLTRQPQMQVQLRPQPAIQEVMRHTPPMIVQSTSPYYQGSGVGGGGYLAAVHSPNPSTQPFNQSLNVGVGDVVASSYSGLLSGFNTAASLGSQHNYRSQILPPQFNQNGHTDREVESILRANMANSNVASYSDHWPQSFVGGANHRASDASLWSTISTTSSRGNTQNNIGAGSFSLMQNHLPNRPWYGDHQ